MRRSKEYIGLDYENIFIFKIFFVFIWVIIVQIRRENLKKVMTRVRNESAHRINKDHHCKCRLHHHIQTTYETATGTFAPRCKSRANQ